MAEKRDARELRSKLGTVVQAADPIKLPCGRIWPNGDFSLGFASKMEQSTSEDEWRWGACQPEALMEGIDHWDGVTPLTLSDVCNSDTGSSVRGKYGLKGITGRGRHMVTSGAYLLEKKLGRRDVVMITLTVPQLGQRSRQLLAQKWGQLVNELVKWLTRRLEAARRSPAIIGVTEIQTGRLSKYQEGYLHLHLLCPCHSNSGVRFAIDADELRAWWRAAINRIGETTLHVSPRVETEQVKKSCEGYLGKYLSKGSGIDLEAFIEDLGVESVPGQWWFCSALMRQRIRENTSEGYVAGELLETVISYVVETGSEDIFKFLRPVMVQLDGIETCVGWYGKLNEVASRDLHDLLRMRHPQTGRRLASEDVSGR